MSYIRRISYFMLYPIILRAHTKDIYIFYYYTIRVPNLYTLYNSLLSLKGTSRGV